ncbi:MAG: ATP-binding protein [Bdellovibrionota bacterium]
MDRISMLQELGTPTFKKELRVLSVGLGRSEKDFLQQALSMSENYLCKVRHESEFEEILDLVGNDEINVFVWRAPKRDEERKLQLSALKKISGFCAVIAYCTTKEEMDVVPALKVGIVHSYYLKESNSPMSVIAALEQCLDRRSQINQKRLIQKLLKTEESFRRVITSSTDGIVIVDKDNQVKFINPKAESLFDVNPLKILNMPFPEDLRKDTVWIKELERTLDKSLYVQFQTVAINWDGELCYLSTIRDITSRILLEKKKDDFFSVVSHEIRTPITVIKEGISQVLEGMHGPLTDFQQQLLSLSLDSTNELNALITNLLDLSKLEVNKTKLDWKMAKIGDIVDKVARKFRLPGEKKGLTVEAVIPESPPTLFLDPGKITQVLTNLMSNALKFTDKGEIRILLDDMEDRIKISVSDTGMGIPKKDLDRIFDRFEQVGRDQHGGTQGTGLGLAICKGIVELHGGKIYATSIAGQGTQFHLEIPKKDFDTICTDYIEENIQKTKDEIFWTMVVETPDQDENKLNQWFTAIQKTLRSNSDFCLKNGSKIFIIMYDVKDLALEVFEQRLRYIETKVGITDVKLLLAAFPADGNNARSLLKKINQSHS